MKTTLFLIISRLMLQVSAAACPFQQLRDLGLLSPDDAAEFDAVKRDYTHSSVLLEERQTKRDLFDDLNNVLGDVESLPLGGGLRMYPYNATCVVSPI